MPDPTLQEILNLLRQHKHLGNDASVLPDYVKLILSSYVTGQILQVDSNKKLVLVTLAAAGFQPLDTGLTSISALTTAANKMIYTTGLDVYAVTALTAFARTLLDDANAATARATLGISSGATKLLGDTGLHTTSSTSETSLFSGTIPAGTLGTANVIRIKIRVSSFDMNANGIYSIRIKYGSGLTITLSIPSGTLTVTRGWIEAYIHADGATDTQEAYASIFTKREGVAVTQSINDHARASGTTDSTSDQTFDITGQSTNSAPDSGSLSIRGILVDLISA